MSLPYCEKFGFDAGKIAERLQWLEFDADDHATGRHLQQVIIGPNVATIVDDFYRWLTQNPEARKLLVDDELIVRLKQTQTHYLLSLGIDFHLADYFESRLRVGQAHVWVGLSISLYQCAYRYLADLIFQRIDCQHRDAPKLIAFLQKIIALDMSLAIETYHLTHVQTLEESLDRSQRQQKRLRMAAATDSLTGLANHETIISMLNEALANQQRPVAAVMVDIDHFKQVNDTHGHPVGDKVLIEAAQRIRSALRDFDDIGRYGGEEFLLLLNGSSAATAQHIAERVRQHVASQPIHLQGLEVPITISLGVAPSHPGESAGDLLKRADKALYAAKAAGRNCVVIADA